MMLYVSGGICIVLFTLLIKTFNLVSNSKAVILQAKASFQVIRNKNLEDDEKEKSLQKASIRLIGLFFKILFGTLFAAGIPLVIIWLLGQTGLISLSELIEQSTSVPFILITTGLALVVLLIMYGLTRRYSNYSFSERFLHWIAFHSGFAQLSLSDFEDKRYRKKLENLRIDRPVFITALPRAGTTLLLEILASQDEFVTHCYRNMPFVAIPLFWARFSSRFKKQGEKRERAHGDGMQIDYDSPEAFEEVIWKLFWKKQYRADRIKPWELKENEEFSAFFKQHIRKMLLLGDPDITGNKRYLSKNNLNIARIPCLHRLFEDAIILVPFRDPIQHAHSLLKQHRNFTQIHESDPFAAKYMRDIGHFDFGKNLRPVDFDDWVDAKNTADSFHISYWLEYWIAAYQHLLPLSEKYIQLIHYDVFCNDPGPGLAQLGRLIEIRDPAALMQSAPMIRPARKADVSLEGVPESLLSEVNALYGRLQS